MSDDEMLDGSATESISSLIRKKVNRLGELHLDKVQTELLMRYLIRLEMTVADYERTAKKLAEIVKKVPS